MITRPRGVALLVLLVVSLAPVLATAADPLKQCNRGVEADPSTRDAWGCFYRAARSGADWSDAEASLRASMTRNASALSKPSPRGYALLTLANIVAEHEPAAGLALYEDALKALTEGEDHLAQILTLLNMAHRYRSTGAPQRGAEALELASVAADALGDPKWIATVAVEAVRHDLRTQGDLGRAERRMADVESLLFPDGSVQAKLTWLNTAGSVAQRLGKLHVAHALAVRLVVLAEAEGDTYVQAAGQYNVLLQRRSLRFDAGGAESPAFAKDVRDALSLAVAAENTSAQLSLQQLLVDVLVDLGSLAEAESVARASLADATEFADPRLEVGAVLSLARALLRPPGALEERTQAELGSLAQRARVSTQRSEHPDDLTVIAMLEAEVAWRSGKLEHATVAHEESLRIFEGLRSEQANLQGRAELLGRQGEVFKSYVAHLLGDADGTVVPPASPSDAGPLAAAFSVSERYRARALRENLASTDSSPRTTEIRASITRVQRRIRGTALNPPERDSAQQELEQLERDELERLAMQTSMLTREGLVSISELAAALGPDEALLAYQLGGQFDFAQDQSRGSWVLVVTRERVHATRLPSSSALRPALEMFGPAMEQGLDDDVRRAAQALGRQLVEEPLASLPRRPTQLTLLLDDQLHQLPFAAMRSSSDGRLLLHHYEITMAPSATVLHRARRSDESPRARPTSVLALADPIGGLSNVSLHGDDGLQPLPHARQEARQVAHAPGDAAWFGSDASETALLNADLAPYGVIHFATHAIVDGTTPRRSAIVLAPGDADGLLQPRDIAQLKLEGKLVVLSACQSAGGQVLSGEGVLGLAHALLSAEATTIVGTLWPIPDDDAMRLFERFYVELDAGRSVASALSRAQAKLADEGVPTSAWAGAVVLGDGTMVPFPGGRTRRPETEVSAGTDSKWYGVAGVLAVGAAFGLMFGVRRARRA